MLSFNLAEWVSIISTGATLLMVVATWKMANITRLTLEEQNKPYVVVYPQQQKESPTIIELVIENIGVSPAYGITFKVSDNLLTNAWGIENSSCEPNKFLDGPFVDGITYLPPRGKRVLYWGQFGGIMETLQGKPAEVVTVFRNSPKRKQYTTYSSIDVKDFLGVTANDSVAVKQQKSIELISKNMDKLIQILDRKLHIQSPETAYKWAYIVWCLLKQKGFSHAKIFSVGRGAGLTDEQMLNAENAAYSLLQEYCPDQFPKADQS